MAATEYMNSPNILGRYSIKHTVLELCAPILMNENAVIPPKYMYIRKAIRFHQLEGPRKSLAANSTQLKAIRFHQHLKTVEYLGYAGRAFAADLALCLTWLAPMLRRFIFDTRQTQFIGMPCEVYTSDYRDQMEIVRSKTELLAEHIRGSQGLADVVIL